MIQTALILKNVTWQAENVVTYAMLEPNVQLVSTAHLIALLMGNVSPAYKIVTVIVSKNAIKINAFEFNVLILQISVIALYTLNVFSLEIVLKLKEKMKIARS